MKKLIFLIAILLLADSVSSFDVLGQRFTPSNCSSVACILSDDLFTDAANITGGTLPDARLSSNVPLKDAVNVFTEDNNYANVSIENIYMTDIFYQFNSGVPVLKVQSYGGSAIDITNMFSGAIITLAADKSIVLSTAGETNKNIYPTTNLGYNLGKSGNAFNNLWLGGVLCLSGDCIGDWGAINFSVADGNDFFNHADVENVLQEIGDTIKNGLREPTGFPLKTDTPININFSDGNRMLSVSPSGTDFNFFIKGKLFIKTAEETLEATDDEGVHYFYYDSAGSLAENVTPTAEEIEDIIRNDVQVAVTYWNTTDNNTIYFTGMNELHGTQMDGDTHEYLHFTRGSIFLSGFAVGDIVADNGGDLNTDAQLSVTGGRFEDEDIEMEIVDGSPQTLSLPAELPIFYKTGSSLWKKINATTFVISTTGSGRAAYNLNTGGNWSLEEVTNNKFTLSHIFATNNSLEPVIIIMGENEYGSKIDARTGAVTELNDITTAGLGFQEFVPIATILFQTNTTYSNPVKSQIVSTDSGEDFVDWRFQELSPSVTPSSHSNLTGLTNDDHQQYIPTDGTRPFTANWYAGAFTNSFEDINSTRAIIQDANVLNDFNANKNVIIDENVFVSDWCFSGSPNNCLVFATYNSAINKLQFRFQ